MSVKDGRSSGLRDIAGAGRGGRKQRRISKSSEQSRVDDSDLRDKDPTIHRLSFQLEKTAEELKRVKEHSKIQSKKIKELLSSAQVLLTPTMTSVLCTFIFMCMYI